MIDPTTTMASSDPVATLDQVFRGAIVRLFGPGFEDVDPIIRSSQNPEFGDFQANVAMSLAKRLGRKPHEIAQEIAQGVVPDLAEIAEAPDVAGPGFINIRLRSDTLRQMVQSMHAHDLGVAPSTDAHTVVIDLCSVNVAKQMHVGHLRSTIIGDSLGRVLERTGRRVIRQNHLGDWGLQIGMVLHQLRAQGVDLDKLVLSELETAYRDAQLACKGDAAGLAAARKGGGPHRIAELEAQNEGATALLDDVKVTLVSLQQGDEELVRDWKKLIICTMRAVYETVDVLNVHLDEATERGESFYRDRLSGVVTDFQAKHIAHKDEGAIVVPFADRERPLLIRKSDGGFLYATTDLAAIRYRVQELNADRIIYVVGAPQRDHFRDVFDAARLIGWHLAEDGTSAQLVHVPFGSVLDENKRLLRTRSGDNVKLIDLLNEAIARGTQQVRDRAADPKAPTHGLTESELADIGRAVGIGAVKYADLSSDLVRDYIFSLDRMIVFEGNTGPYIQYAHARICSIFAKVDTAAEEVDSAAIQLIEPGERALALLLLRYGSVVAAVADSLEPHRLCNYLFDLANAFSSFYQSCPVLRAESEPARRSRLRLCALTRDVIADGLGLLGIEAPARM